VIKITQYGFRDGRLILKKLTVEDKMPVSYTIPYFRGVSSTAILEAWDVSAGTAVKYNTAFSVQPPYAVELSVHAVAAGTADGAAGDGLIFKGWDAKGNWIQETVYVSSTNGTSADAYSYTNNSFAKIYSIVPDDALHKSTDVNIGWRDVVGLPYQIDAASDILTAQVGLNYATTALTVDKTYDSVSLSGLSEGSTFNIVWLSRVQ